MTLIDFADAHPQSPLPGSCLRCRLPSRRLGSEWCCAELALLERLMTRREPPTMRELMRVHFIGRGASSIDRACRRYGLKTPARGERAARRKRCPGCGDLMARGATACAQGCNVRRVA